MKRQTLCFTVAFSPQPKTTHMLKKLEWKRDSHRDRRALAASCPVALCVCFCVSPLWFTHKNTIDVEPLLGNYPSIEPQQPIFLLFCGWMLCRMVLPSRMRRCRTPAAYQQYTSSKPAANQQHTVSSLPLTAFLHIFVAYLYCISLFAYLHCISLLHI